MKVNARGWGIYFKDYFRIDRFQGKKLVKKNRGRSCQK